MKTFKAVRFQIVSEQGGLTEFELEDGVIINKENRGTGWLLEIVISDAHYEAMKQYQDEGRLLDIRVVITRPSNDPALFDATIQRITKLDKTISVVFECHIYTLRQVYAESLLEQLVDEGLSGEELKKTFNRMMKSKPKLKDERANK
ncbi:YwpF-like family protein [Staphylococcus pettenkoferi]|uniref:YwpF-like family protein n=1 Tax=Staphylococcus pettenkoferi TaxID=170573 RepID=A0A9Q4GZM9_9STAP|nr:YwpF-like family protein [Staphylococcus pettenkoferi]MCY1565425.1 YwpF-like family protein [Staphylococcus pettenkoferi]MCY1569061.1 YwpF-like family protein [Staphylococcus pettenkoferi]MCY1570885.1 YwpF-like family protein [Staphylococcus pettenkoferi]MCY1577009.1 YwpF-like family protein [Staphylococcus pettenkoferi]MCY1582309.1 YwpF-like family protein [Staphylococcus pettenkoferi]